MSAVELTNSEREAFAALLKALVTADDRVSPEEEMRLSHLIQVVGAQAFALAPDLVVTDAAGIAAAAAAVDRPAARAEILRLLTAAAEVDGVAAPEASLLDQLRHAWAVSAP